MIKLSKGPLKLIKNTHLKKIKLNSLSGISNDSFVSKLKLLAFNGNAKK